MSLGRRAEHVAFVTHARKLACRLAVAAVALAPPNAAALAYRDATARLSIDLDGFPTLEVARSVDVDVEFMYGAATGLQVETIDFAGGALDATFSDVQGSVLGADFFWLDADLAPGAAHFGFASELDELVGPMPIGGEARLCVSPCGGIEPTFTVPLGALGQDAISVGSVSVQGALWTTGRVTVGERDVRGSREELRESWGSDVVYPWWAVSLVTPIRIWVDPNAPPITGTGRLDLTAFTPACSDGKDNDGDGRVDFPDDPGCSDAFDLDEPLEIYGDGDVEIPDALPAGESIFVSGPQPGSARLRIRDPMDLGEVRAGYAVVTMRGGTVRGELDLMSATAIVTGGTLPSLNVLYDSAATLRGTNFDHPRGPVSALQGRITGTLADGTPLDLQFFRDPDSLLAVPEPGSQAAGAGTLLALAAIAMRARSAPRRAEATAE